MQKITALDVGDVWTGIAISDALGITARPYSTVKTEQLCESIRNIITQERISTIIVGLPKTMKGLESEQTTKVRAIFDSLMLHFPAISWKLWDERLSSKRANELKHARSKKEKTKSHAIAAAFILSSYLLAQTFESPCHTDDSEDN